LFAKRKPPLQTIEYEGVSSSRELEYGVYYIRPPVCAQLHPNNDNHYTNSTSLVFWFRSGNDTMLFPGDIMPDGMAHLLANRRGTEKRFTRFDANANGNQWHFATSNQPDLKTLLTQHGLSVLVAPHHGLESCFSEDLYKAIRGGKPRTVVISESEMLHDNFGGTHPIYQSDRGAELVKMEVDRAWESRRSVTTKADHHILVIMSGEGRPVIYANTDPDYLLRILK
jgi:beta-lactamase superfamily II metal-dependent hydrolase